MKAVTVEVEPTQIGTERRERLTGGHGFLSRQSFTMVQTT